MKKLLTFTFAAILLSLLAACHKTDEPVTPNPEPPAPEPLVKKYLVRETWEDEDDIILKIDWNEDFSQIKRISYTPTGSCYYQVDYDFTYYGIDSIHVIMNKPDVSWAQAIFNNFICHLQNNKITSIDYYVGSNECTTTWNYEYDEKGRLIVAGPCSFIWDGENSIEGVIGSNHYKYENFGEGFHPYSTFPYFLYSGVWYGNPYLITPLWKNAILFENTINEYDEEGYLEKIYIIKPEGDTILSKRYYYATCPQNNNPL